MNIKLELKWQDLWIGIFHKQELKIEIGGMIMYFPMQYEVIKTMEQHIWICLIPCLPIHIWWEISKSEGRSGVIA